MASSRCARRIGVDIVDRIEIGDAQRGGDDCSGRAGDAVGGENQVVGAVLAGEPLTKVSPDGFAEGFAGELLTLVGVDVVAVRRRPVHEFVGQFVVVLQRVDQRGGIDAQCQGGAQREAQKFGVGGG